MAKESTSEQGKPKNKMKLIIIILTQVILLMGVAGGVMIYMKQMTPAAAVAAGAPGAHGKKAEEPPGEIFALEPFVVNIHQGAEIRYLRVKVELEAIAGGEKGGGGEHGGGGKKGGLDSKQTQLRDAIITILSTKSLADVETLEGKNKLREEILKMCEEKIQSPKVTKVYFTDFVIQ